MCTTVLSSACEEFLPRTHAVMATENVSFPAESDDVSRVDEHCSEDPSEIVSTEDLRVQDVSEQRNEDCSDSSPHIGSEDDSELVQEFKNLSPNSKKKALTLYWQSEMSSVSILMTGKTGCGKSTLTNGILGLKLNEQAEEGDSIVQRCTTRVTQYQKKKRGVNVTIWDSPGLQDGTSDQDRYLNEIMEKCSNVDLKIYCTKMNETRFVPGDDNPDVVAMKKFTEALGPEFWKNAIIVLTYANTLEAFNVHWRKLNPKQKAKAFVAKVEEWEKQIKLILIK